MKYLIFLLLSSCAHYPDGYKSDADYIHSLETTNRNLEIKYLAVLAKLEREHKELSKEKEKISQVKAVIKQDLKNIVSESLDKKDVK